MKNLIVGMVYSYQLDRIAPFFKSLNQSACDASCLLFINNLSRSTISGLRDLGVQLLDMDPSAFRPQHVNNARWLSFYNYFSEPQRAVNLPDAILFTDVRDVAFQADPFNDYSEGINCYLETKKISDCYINRQWILDCYGEDVLERLGHHTITCSGTTIVTKDYILPYLKAMRDGLDNLSNHTKKLVSDQAVHNYLVREGKLDKTVIHANGDHVLTIGTAGSVDYRVLPDAICNNDGVACPIIHQYDRNPEAVKAIGRRIGIARMPELKRRHSWLRRATKPVRHALISVVKWPFQGAMRLFALGKISRNEK